MRSARKGHTATLLPNGKVLVAGGYGTDSPDDGSYGVLASAELYDPLTGVFTPTGAMGFVRGNHTATLLPNGKVLVVGGQSAELYDQATGTFSPTGAMGFVRKRGFTATLLRNGKVLIAGGGINNDEDSGKSPLSSELYEPSTGKFLPTGLMSVPRFGHTATLLPDGKVLVAGGLGIKLSGDLFDVASEQFTPTKGAMRIFRWEHTATLLPSGKVLLSGGRGNPQQDIYDPSTETFSQTGAFGRPDSGFTTTLLSNGNVLFAGGHVDTGMLWISISDVMDYDPIKGNSLLVGHMAGSRLGHSATLLPDGKILFAGGGEAGYKGKIMSSYELYNPAVVLVGN